MSEEQSNPNKVFVIGGPEANKELLVPETYDAIYVSEGEIDLDADRLPKNVRLAEYNMYFPPWGHPRAAVFGGWIEGPDAVAYINKHLGRQEPLPEVEEE